MRWSLLTSAAGNGARLHLALGCLASVLVTSVGCQVPERINSPARHDGGLVVVLPGIEGRSVWNRNIALGLDEGGVASAIEIYDWTTGVPGNFVYNLANLKRNRRQAREVAGRILDYLQRHPGRPVHIVGHSGGGGIAVLALEVLPPGRQIEQAILLAPALSPEYDLSLALRRTRRGMVSFYSARDVTLLTVGTSLLGPIDRDFGASAGAVGFREPEGSNESDRPGESDGALYAGRLRQVRWSPRLKQAGADGSHLGWASRRFAREYLAPLIKEHEAARPLRAEEVE